MKRFLFPFISVGVFLALFVWVAWHFVQANQPQPLKLQGEVEAQNYNIASKVPGRIAKIYVKKGMMLHKGDMVFSIDSPEIQAKLHQALAAKEAAQAQKEQADNGARKQQIKAATQQWKKAKAAATFLEKTYKRIQRLYDAGVVSLQKRDEIYTKYLAAKADEKAAFEMMQLVKEGARKEVKKAATAQEKVYASKVDEVEVFVKETTIYSPYEGEVSQILIHEEELSPAGFPVVMLTDLNDVWVSLHVREDLLQYFTKGSTHTAYIPALDKKVQFRVSFIAPQGEYATYKASQNSDGYDMKSFSIELRPTADVKNLRQGMSVLFSIPKR
jgi:HlyD family secretion protein